MNNYEWINEIDWQDLKDPKECNRGEEVYTLYLKDFLRMPDVDFATLALYDPHLRSLMN